MLKRAATFVLGGLFMAALPFGFEPHLLQKWKLFVNGWLHKPEDWLDFAFHGLPLLLSLVYLGYVLVRSRGQKSVAT